MTIKGGIFLSSAVCHVVTEATFSFPGSRCYNERVELSIHGNADRKVQLTQLKTNILTTVLKLLGHFVITAKLSELHFFFCFLLM